MAEIVFIQPGQTPPEPEPTDTAQEGKSTAAEKASAPWLMRRGTLLLGLALVLIGVSLVGFGPVRTGLTDQAALARGDALSDRLEDSWAEPVVEQVELGKAKMTRPLGEGFAFIYIPRLGKEWRAVIVEGVDQPDLEGAIGHFPKTADPGMLGNFALAGHRNMDGSLFGNLDQVSKGDKIIIETRERWVTYTVTGSSIISPSQIDVIDPVPFEKDAEPTKAVITLTTCHPWWSSAQRLALFGKLTETRLKNMGPPEDLPEASLRQ